VTLLAAAGFRLWLDTPRPVPSPLMERLDYLGMDLQVNIFGVRA
jgi:hypothetical protein